MMEKHFGCIIKLMTRYQKTVAVVDAGCNLLATLSQKGDSDSIGRALHEAEACAFIIKAVETNTASNCFSQAFSAIKTILSSVDLLEERAKCLRAMQDAMEKNNANNEVRSQGRDLLDHFGES